MPWSLEKCDGQKNVAPVTLVCGRDAFLLLISSAHRFAFFFATGGRYELDFLPALLLLSVIGYFGIERRAASTPAWRHATQWGWCLLLAVPVVVNFMRNIENRAEAETLVGNTFLAVKNEAAMAQFQTALALWPDCVDAHDGVGYVLWQEGRVADAIVQYQKALEIKPDVAQARNNLASCLYQAGRKDEAIDQFQKTVAINSRHGDAYNKPGTCLS